MKNSNCIIITQKEWLNWLAFGYLRVSPSRISYFDNTESESSFDKLMSYSVDNALDEEDAYLIASLVNDYSREELHVKRTSLSDYILVQAVQGFYTLSAKGADLLEYEAGQSHSILHYDSKIENLWNEWKNTQFKLRSHDKGNKFLEILEYPRFEVEPKINDEHLFSLTLKNYNLRSLHPQLQDRQKRSSFAWLVINQEFKEKIGESLYLKYYKFRQNNQNLEIQDIAETYRNLEKDFITDDTQSLFDYPSLIAEKSFFDKWHSDHSEPKEHYLASTILVHYYNILENNYEINILALSKDLMLLDEIYSTKYISQLITYFIGRRLNEVYLNSLYIAKNIDQKKLGMFEPNFFYKLKKEELTLCNINQVQLQNIISKVNIIAKDIQLAYNKEANNEQDSELESDTIEEKDGDSNQTTQPHLEAKNSFDSEESEDSTNRINNSHQPTQSQTLTIDNSIIETNNTLSNEKVHTPINTTDSNSTEPHSETQKSVDSQDSVDNTKDMNKPDEIECDAKLSNISTTINNEDETIKRDQVQKDKKSIDTPLNGDLFSLENTKQELSPINPTELLDDAISTIEELPEGKENHGGFFQDSLFSKNARYKNEFKDLKRLPEFFEAFAKIVGNDMKIHKSFGGFKKELLSNSNLPNK